MCQNEKHNVKKNHNQFIFFIFQTPSPTTILGHIQQSSDSAAVIRPTRVGTFEVCVSIFDSHNVSSNFVLCVYISFVLYSLTGAIPVYVAELSDPYVFPYDPSAMSSTLDVTHAL